MKKAKEFNLSQILASSPPSIDRVEYFYGRLKVDNYLIKLDEPLLQLTLVCLPTKYAHDRRSMVSVHDLMSLYSSFTDKYWGRQFNEHKEYLRQSHSIRSFADLSFRLVREIGERNNLKFTQFATYLEFPHYYVDVEEKEIPQVCRNFISAFLEINKLTLKDGVVLETPSSFEAG